MGTIFKGGWDSIKELRKAFWPEYDERSAYKNELDGASILLVALDGSGYEESVFVLLDRSGELFEVNASHCSCMGFEGQWNEEKTTKAALMHRIDKGTLGELFDACSSGQEFSEDLKHILEDYK